MLSLIAQAIAGLFGIGISTYAAVSTVLFTSDTVRALAATVGSQKSSQKTAIGQ